MSYYSPKELIKLGFLSFGKNVQVSKRASIYGADRISIGNSVRIDDFTLLSGAGGIRIGSFVHISAYAAIYGGGGVVIGDYSGMSPRSTIFSESDDFSGESMIHSFFDLEFKPGFKSAPVHLGRFVQLGACTTVLPGCNMSDGTVTGAHSLINKSTLAWSIYMGVPARWVKNRSRAVEEMAKHAIFNSRL